MNQMTLNQIAMTFLKDQSLEVAGKLKEVILEDGQERIQHVDGPVLHHIHNEALFNVLLKINSLFTQQERSKAAVSEYLRHADPLRAQFFDIVDALKGFQPTNTPSDEPK